jgi:hypothetical protein
MRWPGRVLAPDNQPSMWWSLIIVAAAVIGGLAAAALRHVSLLTAVLIPLGVGVITVYAVARWPGQQPVPPPPPAPPPLPPGPIEDRLVHAPVHQAETGDLVRLQPIVSQSATDAQWWQPGDGPPAPPGQDGLLRPAADLVGYLDSALVAQCPDCGAFGIEARRRQKSSRWGFRCESCEFTWHWQPGTPWPPVAVRPGRRKQPRLPAPLSTSRAP